MDLCNIIVKYSNNNKESILPTFVFFFVLMYNIDHHISKCSRCQFSSTGTLRFLFKIIIDEINEYIPDPLINIVWFSIF